MDQTMIDLVVQEHTGGYQDRTPGKQDRYIGWLKKDLVDFPEDGRTLYYLGLAYFEQYTIDQKAKGVDDVTHLITALDYLDRRIAIPDSHDSYYEERW